MLRCFGRSAAAALQQPQWRCRGLVTIKTRPREADQLPGQLGALSIAAEELPVIDLEAPKAAEQVCEACSSFGFLNVANHGIPLNIIKDAEAATRTAFALPLEQKLNQMAIGKAPVYPSTSRGYSVLGAEALDPNAPGDMKEFIDLGPEKPALADPTLRPFTGPNPWPDEHILPAQIFRDPLLMYMQEMDKLARRLLRLIAVGLNVPAAFDNCFEDPVVIHRLIHYPPHDVSDLSRHSGEDGVGLGAGAHTDYGALTILRQMDEPGLQVRHPRSGQWMWAPVLPETFTVNVGDCLQHWTAGRFQSTLHRVINVTGAERYSMAYFFDPDFDVAVDPAALLGKAAETAGYAPFVAGHHKLAKYEAVWQTNYAGDGDLVLGEGSELFKQ